MGVVEEGFGSFIAYCFFYLIDVGVGGAGPGLTTRLIRIHVGLLHPRLGLYRKAAGRFSARLLLC